MVKKKGPVIAFVIIVIIIISVISYFFFPDLTNENNERPFASIEINVHDSNDVLINEGDTILFSARNSSDNDGNIEEYHWNFGDGSSSNNVDAKHTYDEPGDYNVTLTVVDNDGNKDIQYLQITVNSMPIAIAEVLNFAAGELDSIPIAKPISFVANDSLDEDGWIESYHWDFGDGNESTLEAPTYYYFELGKFKTTLTVVDNNGAIAVDYIEIEIIKRTYTSKWTLKNYEIEIDGNGFTREGQSTENLYNINQENLAQINVSLSWDDRQPFLRDNESEGEDQFELTAVTPENISKISNSTSGNISQIFEYNSQPKNDEFKAKTQSEAITLAEDSASLSNDGNGEWYFNVTAIECKGGNWINDEFDLDVGNTWYLIMVLYYFELDMIEVDD
jgi:PKD repeat protein